MKRQLVNNVNNVNTGINLSTVNNKSKNDNFNTHQSNKVVLPLQQQRLLQVMKRFLFLKQP